MPTSSARDRTGDPASSLSDMFDTYFASHTWRGDVRDLSLYNNHIQPHIAKC
ncbi:MAG: hypothetical protein M0Z95_01410 [Actinomycetota bacterium]|nr:hypothetical protein [Actinomycetota bacterium]